MAGPSIFLFATNLSEHDLGTTQIPVLRVPRVKWLESEADHSLPSNAEVKN
jgi:hypothetical protein